MSDATSNEQYATFGAGCFWCVEAVFKRLEGVLRVEPGYAGGHTDKPTYKEVCSGDTGHAEVLRIAYDPAVVNFATLLRVFFASHDPTTLNRQGNDVGTQYRSVIFYHDDEQQHLALLAKSAVNESDAWSDEVVTEISPLSSYFPAEAEHYDYFARNPEQSYCSFVIRPKVEKVEAAFKGLLKQQYI